MVRSNRALPGLPESSSVKEAIDLLWATDPFATGEGERTAPQPGGRHSCDFDGSSSQGEVFSGLRFRFDVGSSDIELSSPRSPSLYLTHQVADSLLPLVLSCAGRLVLHGAGLVTESGCIVVLGESMAGKSTLTAAWVARGCSFLSDDWISIRLESGRPEALPSHPSVRLREPQALPVGLPGIPFQGWENGYAKRWYSFEHGSAAFPGNPVPLRSVLSFRRSTTASRLSVRRLSPRLAAQQLLSHVFLLDSRSRKCWEPVLDSVAGLVARVPVEEAEAPDGSAGLDALAEFLDADRG